MDSEVTHSRTAIIVVDAPVERDRRVGTMIEDLRRSGFDIAIIDVRAPSPTHNMGTAATAAMLTWWDSCAIFLSGLARFGRFRRFWVRANARKYGYAFFTHYIHEVKSQLHAIYKGHVTRRTRQGQPSLVVANDLVAGGFARAMLGALARERLYYDSHEFSPFRNRENNSIARAAVTLSVEAWVAAGAARMACVSTALRDVCAELYEPPSIEYVPNAYYPPMSFESPKTDASLPLHVVYFGAPSAGRGLNLLGELAARNPDMRVSMFVPDFLPFHPSLEPLRALSNVSIHLGVAYQDELKRVVDTDATILSWCVVEDVCLSYRLAEPSKYHQSIMSGIPVLVAAGQHLADLIKTDGNGIVVPVEGPDVTAAIMRAIRDGLKTRAGEMSAAARRMRQGSSAFPGWRWPGK